MSQDSSPISLLANLPRDEYDAALEKLRSLPERELANLLYSWKFNARKNQLAPDDCTSEDCGCQGLWTTWLVLAGRGFGKLLALDTPIPTPTGWTPIGEIADGDRVFDESGRVCRVVKAHAEEVPERAYRIHFSDGTSIVAGGEHQWVTWTHAERKALYRSGDDATSFPEEWPQWRSRGGLGPRIRTTDEIFATRTVGRRSDSNHCIPVAGALKLPHRDLPIDPYVFGYWLGDGSSRDATITCAVEDQPELRWRVESAGFTFSPRADPISVGVNNGLNTRLRALGVLQDKRVPLAYLRSSPEQRLELLRGLMDTDGHCSTDGNVEFCNMRRALADAVMELARSLGQKPVLYTGRATLLGVDHGEKYRVCWTPTINVFRLRRKADRLRLSETQGLRNRHRMIVKVERVDPVPMRCLTVDSRHSMYLAGESMIPTHNTRTGSETCHDLADQHPGCRIALIAPTAGDARDVLLEGESGILNTQRPWNKVLYEPSKRRVTWLETGAIGSIYSADEPNRLRGPQHHFAWCDELCAWPDPDQMWAMLKFGLRLPSRYGWPKNYRPRIIVTTTPLPIEIIRRLCGIGRDAQGKVFVKAKTTHITTGSTYDNRANLDEEFFASVITEYEGTRLGRQELNGEVLGDVPGALWKSDWIDLTRITDQRLPARIKGSCVAVDPAATDKGKSNLTGIVVCAAGAPPGDDSVDDDDESEIKPIKSRRLHGYVLADYSMKASPDVWARKAVWAHKEFGTDCIVAEGNQGGEMVRHTIHSIDPNVDVKLVSATQGKKLRAEPVVALYEQKRIHHVGRHQLLEEQMLTWDPEVSKSPDRIDALVWGLTHLMVGRRRGRAIHPPQGVGYRANPWIIGLE